MKKIMICGITLLPLIILLTLFVSTTVIGFSTYVYVSGIEFVQEEVCLRKTSDSTVTEKLKVNVFPMQADNKEVEFWSDDTSVVTVSADGEIASVDFGSTYVRVRSKEKPALQAACYVTVTDDKIHRITITDFPEKLYFGESARLACTYAPTGVSNINLEYESLNEDVATVSADGVVTANRVNGGYATIRVCSEENPQATDEVTVKVCGAIKSLDFTDHADILSAEKSFDLPQIAIYPENATWGNDLSYSISDEDVASLENGKIVFRGAGKVTLTVRDEYGHEIKKDYESTWGHYRTIAFTEPATEIERNYEDYPQGTPIELSYTATPQSATMPITLGSSDPSVIRVENGKFFVVGGGRTLVSMSITTCTGEQVETSLTVTIKRRTTSIAFVDETGDVVRSAVTLDGSMSLSVAIAPDDATGGVEYAIVSGDGATVNSDGLLSFDSTTSPETVTVRATSYGGAYADVEVTYIPALANPVKIDGESLSFIMPDSHAEQKVTFTPYLELYSEYAELTYGITGDGATASNGTIAITKTGVFTLTVKSRGATVKSVTVTVTRKAERVTAELWESWDGEPARKWSGSGSLYTSAKTIEIKNIAVSPSNATKLVPDSVESDDESIATVEQSGNDYKLNFNKAGTVTVTITVDDVRFSATVKSTYGMLDDNATVTVTGKTVYLNTTLAVSDILTVTNVSPFGGKVSGAEIELVNGNADIFPDKQSVTFNARGEAKLQISYNTVSGRINTKTITFTVIEKPTDISLSRGEFVVLESNTVSISELYGVLPSTATVTSADYVLEHGYSYATLEGGVLTFTEAGKVVVTVTLDGEFTQKIAVVYYGDASRLSDEFVEVGESFALDIDENTLSATDEFTLSGSTATITNDLIITVSSVGAFTVSIGGSTYEFEGVVKATGVTVAICDNESDAQAHKLSDGTFLTGLNSVTLTAAVQGTDVTYTAISYSVSDTSIATVSTAGVLTFTKAGTVTVTAQEKFGKKATLTIESTLGAFTSITATSATLTLDYDDDSLVSGFDFISYFGGYPTQLALGEKAEIEISALTHGVTATVNEFIVSLTGRSNFTVKCKQGDISASIAVTVNRSVENIAVTVDGTAVDGTSVTLDRSFADIKADLLPFDANQELTVTAALSSGYTGSAKLTDQGDYSWRIMFTQSGEEVPIVFTYGNGKTKTISLTTNLLSQSVDFTADKLVVVKDGLFTFSNAGLNLSELTLTGATLETVGSNYRVAKSGTFTLNGKNGGASFSKTLIVTSEFSGFNGVSVVDVDRDGNTVTVAIAEDGVHSTASNALLVKFDGVGDAINVDGSAPTVNWSADNTDIANIVQSGEVTFVSGGTVVITVTVSGTKLSGDYKYTYSFKLYSSLGKIDEFTLEHEGSTYGIVIDETREYTPVCAPIAPSYGVLTPAFEYASSDSDVATVDNGTVTFVGTGIVTVTVSTVRCDGTKYSKTIIFKVDKLIDEITVVDGENTNKQRSSVIVNSESYSINTDVHFLGSGIAPTLTKLVYSVKDGKSGCTVDANGLVTFASGSTGEFIIVITAESGDARTEFSIVKVAQTVNIITVDARTAVPTAMILTAGKTYAIDAGFGPAVPTVTIPAALGEADTTGAFTPLNGTQSDITITYSGSAASLTAIVEQPVEDITFKSGYPSSVYDANSSFNLTELFGASVKPASAGRAVDGAFVAYNLNIDVSDHTIARVTKSASGDSILTFNKGGKITLTFTAGGVTKRISVQSTCGYAEEITLDWENRTFNFSESEYTLTPADYTVSPANAGPEKYALTLTSTNENVIAVDGFKIIFTGGGEATLKVSYKTSESVTTTLTVAVKVIKHADGMTVRYNASETQNVLTEDESFTLNAALDGDDLSPHVIEYASSDSGVATVDQNGKVTFLQTGSDCVITVTAKSSYDSEVVASTAVTVRRAPNKITEVDKTSSVAEFNYDDGQNYSLYYIGSTQKSTFEITDESGTPTSSSVLSVSENGDITFLECGSAFITVTDENGGRKTFEVFVYKRATDVALKPELADYRIGDEYVTANNTLSLFEGTPVGAILPESAAYGKTVEFSYDDTVATIDEDGNVTFLKTDVLNLTVTVKRGDATELTKLIKLRSTLGNAITAKLYKGGELASSACTVDVGKSVTFTLGDLSPVDLVLTSANFTATTSTTGVVTITTNANARTVTVTGVGKGACSLTISVAGKTFMIDITCLLKVSSVSVTHDGEEITAMNTLEPQFTLTATALPVTASNTTVQWICSDGITVDERGNFTITGGYGTYTVNAMATDGSGCSVTVTVVYTDLTGFSLKFGDKAVQNDYTTYLAYNENKFTFTVLPNPDSLAGVSINNFGVRSLGGYTYAIARDQNAFKITLTTPESANELHFEDEIEVTYKNKYAVNFKVYRSGVSSVTFKYYNPLATNPTNANLDNALDNTFGYQEMRVFGNRSYYGGVKGYYKMYVDVKPRQDYLKYVVFSAEKGISVTTDANDNSFVYVNFNGYTGSSLNAILADLAYDFSDGAARVSATDVGAKLGFSAYAYNFHVVDGVNVFDRDGYLSGGDNVVLHVNLGHDDEQNSNMANCVKFDEYASADNLLVVNKSVIYGNGYLINFANKNNYNTSGLSKNPKAETSYGYTVIFITNAINARLKGTNDVVNGDTSKEYYFIELTGVANIYYCEAYNMYRVIEAGNENVNVKRCVFHTCASSGVINATQEKDADDVSGYYIEDVIMFDTGSRTIETHANPLYVKGFLDIYNFQNKEMFKAAMEKETAVIGGSIGNNVFNEIKKYSDYTEEYNGDTWFNMVGLSAKGSDRRMYYYDAASSSYKLITTTESASNGLRKLEISYRFIVTYNFSVWTYPKAAADNDYIGVARQYDESGNLRYSEMMSTTWKITRSQTRP